MPTTSFFFFNDTATTEIYTLSLHDALPICSSSTEEVGGLAFIGGTPSFSARDPNDAYGNLINERSEEHTSELQSRPHLVCRLLLEKKKHANAVLHRQRDMHMPEYT